MLENYHNGKAAEENAALRQSLSEMQAKHADLEATVKRLISEKPEESSDIDDKIAAAIAKAMEKRGPGRPPKSEAA